MPSNIMVKLLLYQFQRRSFQKDLKKHSKDINSRLPLDLHKSNQINIIYEITAIRKKEKLTFSKVQAANKNQDKETEEEKIM